MPGQPKPYKYQSGDTPTSVAAQFGLSPQQLIDANPGGWPANTGQTINIPQTSYLQPGYQQLAPLFQPANPGRNVQGGGNIFNPYLPQNPGRNVQGGGNMANPFAPSTPGRNVIGGYTYQNTPPPQYTPNNYNVDQRGRGFNQPVINRGQMPGNVGNQAFYQEQVTNALNSPDKPSVLSSYAMQSLGIDPAANGYVYQNGNWILSTSTIDNNTAGADAPTTDNNWKTNPSLHQITYNKYAKNRHSTFQTNLQWAQNAWKRKKQIAKGDRPSGKQQNNQQQQNNITGFGLVDFGASSG